MKSDNEVYVVMEGTKISGIYHYKDDAKDHASAIGGTVISQTVRYKKPTWVLTMIDSAQEKARLQSGTQNGR